MKRMVMCVVFAAATLISVTGVPVAVCAQREANPLAPFEQLIGHEWHLQGSVQVLEWGVGKQSVLTRSYFVIEGERKLVSEGMWFWHPGEQKIRGYFTAVEMPVSFFEYTTRFEDDVMISELVTFTPDGKREEYRETWALSDDTYEWTLYAVSDGAEKKTMGGTYVKKAAE